MASLIIIKGEQVGKKFTLDKSVLLIGRSSKSDICLKEKGVSKAHATIHRRDNGTYYIRKTPTGKDFIIDRQRVETADLKDNAVITIGGALLRFKLGSPEEETRKPASEHSVIFDILKERETYDQTEKLQNGLFNYTPFQVKIILSTAVVLILGGVFIYLLTQYKPDPSKAMEAMAPLAQKVAQSGLVKPGQNQKKDGKKINAYYEDDEKGKLNLSGGPSPKGHINLGNKMDPAAAKNINAPPASSSGGKSAPSSPSSGDNSGPAGKSPLPKNAGGEGATISTGDVQGGAGNGSAGNPNQSGNSAGEPSPGDGQGKGAQIKSGAISGGAKPKDGDLDNMLDDKKQDMEKADNLNLDQYKGKDGVDRKAMQGYSPTGGDGGVDTPDEDKKENQPVPEKDDSEGEEDNRGYYFTLNTYDLCGQALPAVTFDNAGGFVLVWSEFDILYGQRYDVSGLEVGAEFCVSDETMEIPGEPGVTENEDGHYIVVWDTPTSSL